MALKVKRIINDGIFPTSPHRDDEKFLAWIASTPDDHHPEVSTKEENSSHYRSLGRSE